MEKMKTRSNHDIFDIKCLIKNINIKLSARKENGVKQILALITRDDEVVLLYNYGELPTVVKRILWFSERCKTIQAVGFDPSATWLLLVCIDGSLYILPALSLVDKKQKIDCKWSLNDVTHFAKPQQAPSCNPTSVVWWQTLDSNQNALVGFENGVIVLISLTDGRFLGNCSISESIGSLMIYEDSSTEIVTLLINGETQQWKLVLENHSKLYVWPSEINGEETKRKKKFASFEAIRQMLIETRNRRDSHGSDTSDSSIQDSPKCEQPEMLPHLCDTYFLPQFAKNRYYIAALYKPHNLLTIHSCDNIERAPLYTYKLPEDTQNLIFTDFTIITVNGSNQVSILGSKFAESSLENNLSFNEEALITDFQIDKQILDIYRVTDTTINVKKDRTGNNVYKLVKNSDDICTRLPKVDTCLIVTENSVYRVYLSCSPIKKIVQYIIDDENYERAEHLANIFSLNIKYLIDGCGDILISKGAYSTGVKLYKMARVHILKRVLKLAIATDCETLLKYIHLCLQNSRDDLSEFTKLHIGNLAVMSYAEQVLRVGRNEKLAVYIDFMKYLENENLYDIVLAVNVTCQSSQWLIVDFLAISKGVQTDAVTAIAKVLDLAPVETDDYEFLLTLSAPCLTQGLLCTPNSAAVLFKYIRRNLDNLSVDILKRLIIQLDPSQPSALPLVTKVLQSQGSELESSSTDFLERKDSKEAVSVVKDFVETFLLVLIQLAYKTDNQKIFHLSYLKSNNLDMEKEKEGQICEVINKLPDLRPVSCGFQHNAIIRNHSVYTNGFADASCLDYLTVKAVSVSCGRKHTLILTDNGVYAFGSNNLGQLGIGHLVKDCNKPTVITGLIEEKIIDIAAGQYHSLALTANGKVYTWGWGIHGQLGHGDCDNEYYPKLLNFPHKIRQVTAGHAHSFILTCDGKLYGFGSNVFGQLGGAQIDGNKASSPVLVVLEPDDGVPVEKVAANHFLNVALKANQEIYSWGASPQEVRNIQTSSDGKCSDPYKDCVCIYRNTDEKTRIEHVTVGYRHSAILHNGRILLGKTRSDEMCSPKLREEDNMKGLQAQKFIYVACGVDYTIAIDHKGKVLEWGGSSIANMLAGKLIPDQRKMDGKVIMSKNTRRIIKFPHTLQSAEKFPKIIDDLPSLAIKYDNRNSDYKLLLSQKPVPFQFRKIENPHNYNEIEHTQARNFLSYRTQKVNMNFGQKSLHFALEKYFGLYDTDNILQKCLECHNYQAASKIAMLEGHFSDSLGFQLVSFKKYIESLDLDLQSIYNKDFDEKEKESNFIIKNIQEELNEKNLQHFQTSDVGNMNSPGRILSTSSSLDSIRQWGEEEHQGGCESPCEAADVSDIRQNISQYVQSLQNNLQESPPISSVSKLIASSDATQKTDDEFEIKDKTAQDLVNTASELVEFYIKKIYVSENHILMQNVLLKCIEFWLSNNLPVPVLERILLKNLDKYFYPLSILLFCKNFSNPEEDNLKNADCNLKMNSSCFLKEFSTKFCLQLCSMVLENVNKA